MCKHSHDALKHNKAKGGESQLMMKVTARSDESKALPRKGDGTRPEEDDGHEEDEENALEARVVREPVRAGSTKACDEDCGGHDDEYGEAGKDGCGKRGEWG